jgi:hypothetical protein
VKEIDHCFDTVGPSSHIKEHLRKTKSHFGVRYPEFTEEYNW